MDPKRTVTPPGRIIWGSVSEKQTTGYQNVKYEPGKEPFQFGLAIRKDAPGVNELLGLFYQTAIEGYPNNPMMKQKIDAEWQSGFVGGAFKFKIKDGDRPGTRGLNPNAAGCWVFAMSTTLPIKCANAMNQEIDPKTIETGYYADVAISINPNGLTDANAGIYVNPNVVRMLAYGERIIGGPSIDEAFANHAAPTQLPPGASLSPVAPAGGMPQQPQGYPPQQPQGYPPQQPQGYPPQQPQGYPPQQPQQPQQPQGQMPSTAAYPSNGMPAGFPGPGVNQPPPNVPYGTGYPINPATGYPVQPHTQFVNPPR